MTRLTNLTPAEKKFIDDAIAAAERAAGKKLNQPNRHIVLNRARAQIESQRYADRQRALREDERQQIAMQSRRNHQGRFSGMRVRKCAGNGSDAPELR